MYDVCTPIPLLTFLSSSKILIKTIVKEDTLFKWIFEIRRLIVKIKINWTDPDWSKKLSIMKKCNKFICYTCNSYYCGILLLCQSKIISFEINFKVWGFFSFTELYIRANLNCQEIKFFPYIIVSASKGNEKKRGMKDEGRMVDNNLDAVYYWVCLS